MRIHIEKSDRKTVVTCGAHKATVYATVSRGRPVWSLKGKGAAGRRSSTYTSESTAIAAAEDMVVEQSNTGSTIPGLSTKDLIALLSLKERIGGAAKPAMPENMPLTKCIEQFRLSREKKGCGERHRQNLKYHLDKFAKFCVKPIGAVTVRDVNDFLEKVGEPKTQLNFRGSLIALGNFARKQGWLPYGLPTAFESSERPIVKVKEHSVYTPEEMTALLREAEKSEPRLIPWLVLGAFAGIRASERARMSWRHVDFVHRTIILGTEITKTSTRRPIDIPDNLFEWLEQYKGQPILPIKDPAGLYIQIRALADRAKIPWKKNALRASAASYHLMKFENPGKTSLQMGHSEKELKSVYFQPALKPLVDAWWSIRPCKKD